jgi:SAM-dependent methyltransferase
MGMTNKHNAFDEHALEYDTWFDTHSWAYESELRAVRMLLPQGGKGLEIGVGTGRFSAPFGITIGVEPSQAMSEIARQRGITVYDAKAEKLPFADNAFDFVLMVTTLCFLDDPLQAFRESSRVLCPAGTIVIGMLDRDSPPGKLYEMKKRSSQFFKDARFSSVGQVLELLQIAGYDHFRILQTLFHKPEEVAGLEPVKEGYGSGLFVVISARKK